MDREQGRFYTIWVNSWNRGKPLDVQGNISYLFCYVYHVLELPTSEAIVQLTSLIDVYPHEEKFVEYCRYWLSDCFVVIGDYKKTLEVYPVISINSRASSSTDSILSIKLLLGNRISGRDVLTLNGPIVTKWGKEHIEEVVVYLDTIVKVHERHYGLSLIEKWRCTVRYFV